MGEIFPILSTTRRKSIKGALCLIAVLLGLGWGAFPQTRAVETVGRTGMPCYGLASETSDAAACLLSARNERDTITGCTRGVFAFGGAVPASGPAVRVAGFACTSPESISTVIRITAHHLRV